MFKPILLLAASLSGPLFAQGSTPASSTQVGLGCAPTAVIPELTMTPPVLGEDVTVGVLHSFNPSPIVVEVDGDRGSRHIGSRALRFNPSTWSRNTCRYRSLK